MIVILTIILSLASRSITDIRISEDEKEALRAFSAAEAGIEEILKNISLYVGKTDEGVVVGDLEAKVTVAETGEGATQTIEEGEVMTVLLAGASPGTSQLTINWIDTSQGEHTNPASIDISIYDSNARVTRYAYNPLGSSISNDFTAAGNAGDLPYHSKQTITVNVSSDRLARIRTHYGKATIRVSSNGNLLAQQYDITSQAVAEGEDARKISGLIVTRTVPVLPPIFDYVLFSGSGSL